MGRKRAEIEQPILETVRRVVGPVAVSDVSEARIIHQFDLKTDTVTLVAHIALFTDDCASATRLNGRANLYNGPLQKRIQRELSHTLAPSLGVDAIRLQVVGRRSLIDCDSTRPRRKKVDRIGLDQAIARAIVPESGVVAACCRRLGIDFILLRNGQIVGPNPELEDVLASLFDQLPERKPVYDPFSGTRLVERVMKRGRPGVPVVSRDATTWIEESSTNVHDAFTQPPSQEFSAVIVDPLYEDVIFYLKRIAPVLRFQFIVVVAGDVCDVAWNESVQRLLDVMGDGVSELNNRASRFGKRILVYRRSAGGST